MRYYFHFTYKGSDVLRRQITCPRSHNKKMEKLEPEPNQLSSRICTLPSTHYCCHEREHCSTNLLARIFYFSEDNIFPN